MLALALGALGALPTLTSALYCVQFDSNWNLYAFGGENDVNLGQNSSWSAQNAEVKPLTSAGRPPWDGEFTQCMLSQNANAMYVLGGDKADPGSVYIYDFANDAWSKQTTTGAPAALQNSRSSAVLDHDTNVIFTLPGGGASLYELDLGQVVAKAAGTAAWSDVKRPPFDTANYEVTAALASNHISYFGVPSTPAGSADMFVIHYAYFQPDAQAYPTVGGGAAFPATAGQAVSIPSPGSDGPSQMLFVPNGASNSYLVTHWTNPGNYSSTDGSPVAPDLLNSTQTLGAPPSTDAQAAYAASPYELVQIDAQGNIHYLSTGGAYSVASDASWTAAGHQVTGTPSPSSAAPSGAASSAGAAQGGSSASAAPPASGSASNGAASGGAAAPSASASANANSSAVSQMTGGVLGLVLAAALAATAF